MAQEIDWTNNHIQQEIRDTSIQAWELKNNVYAAGLIPSKSSERSTGTYWVYDKKYFMSTQVAKREPGTVPPTAKYAVDTATFNIDSNHLSVPVTNEEIVEASDSLAPLSDAAQFLANNFIVDYELDFANTFVSDDVWGFQAQGKVGATGTGGNAYIKGDSTAKIGADNAAQFEQFDQASASDPINIFKTAIRTIQLEHGLRPNKLLIPRLVFDALMDNDNITTWAANTIGINGSEEQTKVIISQNAGIPLEGIHIVEMTYQDITSISYAARNTQQYNFGYKGTPTFGDMKWMLEKSCLLMYSEGSFNKYSRVAAACMKWDGLIKSLSSSDGRFATGNMGGGVDSPNLLIRGRYVEDNFTHYIDGYFAYDNNVITSTLGFYLKDCIS